MSTNYHCNGLNYLIVFNIASYELDKGVAKKVTESKSLTFPFLAIVLNLFSDIIYKIFLFIHIVIATPCIKV